MVDLQTSLAFLNAPRPDIQADQPPEPDEFGRTPFQHPLLNGLDHLSESAKARQLDKSRLAKLAELYGLAKVIRWKPKNVNFPSLVL